MLLLVALLAGYVAGGPVAEAPSPPPPSVWRGIGPPPAWVETEQASYWLGYDGYCWRALCIKGGPTRPNELAPVVVRRGVVVRFRLGFRPSRALLDLGRSRARLKPARTMSWRVERAGPIRLFVRARAGSVSYQARLVLSQGP